MAESLADIHAITGEPKYLEAATRFSDRRILDPLIAGRDELSGKHANTQIPKVVGFSFDNGTRVVETTSDTSGLPPTGWCWI